MYNEAQIKSESKIKRGKLKLQTTYKPSFEARKLSIVIEKTLVDKKIKKMFKSQKFKNKIHLFIDITKLKENSLNITLLKNIIYFSMKSDLDEIAYIYSKIFNKKENPNMKNKVSFDELKSIFIINNRISSILFGFVSVIENNFQYALIGILDQQNIDLSNIKKENLNNRSRKDTDYIFYILNKTDKFNKPKYKNMENNEIIKNLTFGDKISLLKSLNVKLSDKLFHFSLNEKLDQNPELVNEINFTKLIANLDKIRKIRNWIAHGDFIISRKIIKELNITIKNLIPDAFSMGDSFETTEAQKVHLIKKLNREIEIILVEMKIGIKTKEKIKETIKFVI